MNEREQDLFEVELRQLRPAKLPTELNERLIAALPVSATQPSEPLARSASPTTRFRWLRWVMPATAAAAASMALMIWHEAPQGIEPHQPVHASTIPVLKAYDVEIDRQLVGAFETTGTLPDGEPVRVRVREWMDEVTLRDTTRGVAIQQRTPRLEIIPVSFETF